MYKKRKPVFESVSEERHADYEVKDTRVSDYLRKYGTGHIDDFPQSSAPECPPDPRPVEEMLDSSEPEMATETIDILMEIERNKDKFVKAIQEIELTKKQQQQFKDATDALDDPNTPDDRKREAYAILADLMRQGKVTRARN